jgi:hypothetical protein
MTEMRLLADASAYLVSLAHRNRVESQLGKTKLYKMLFMASWWALADASTRLYIGPWYRIDMGPALMQDQWDALTRALDERFGIEARQVSMWHGYQQVCFGAPRAAPPRSLGSRQTAYLTQAFDHLIKLSAPETAAVTYKTSPMLWLVAEERVKWGGAVQYRRFSLDDVELRRFERLADRYRRGAIDIPEVRAAMGGDWTCHQVALYLDTFGIHRGGDALRLASSERQILAQRVVASLARSTRAGHPSPEERAMASSRIEGEYFVPSTILD